MINKNDMAIEIIRILQDNEYTPFEAIGVLECAKFALLYESYNLERQ